MLSDKEIRLCKALARQHGTTVEKEIAEYKSRMGIPDEQEDQEIDKPQLKKEMQENDDDEEEEEEVEEQEPALPPSKRPRVEQNKQEKPARVEQQRQEKVAQPFELIVEEPVSTLFIDKLAPKSFAECRTFDIFLQKGYDKDRISNLQDFLETNRQLFLRVKARLKDAKQGKDLKLVAVLEKQLADVQVFGFAGPSASGKTLWIRLFAAATNRELIVLHETDAEELDQFLELAVQPRIDGDKRERVWACEGWDALAETCRATLTVLKKWLPQMAQSGIVIATANDGFDLAKSGILNWVVFKTLSPDEAAAALVSATQHGEAITSISFENAQELLSFSGNNLASALCSLQFYNGAPPKHSGLRLPPANLHLLANQGLANPKAERDALLAEADAEAGLCFLHEEAPHAVCAACPSCMMSVKNGFVNGHNGGKAKCFASLDKLIKALDACSAADCSGEQWGGWGTSALTSGPLQRFLSYNDEKLLLPSLIPAPQIKYKLKDQDKHFLQRQKRIAEKYGYYSHERNFLTKVDISKGLLKLKEQESHSWVVKAGEGEFLRVDKGNKRGEEKKVKKSKDATNLQIDVDYYDTRHHFLDGLEGWKTWQTSAEEKKIWGVQEFVSQPQQEEIDALVAEWEANH